jgi:hypothetical protein
MTITPLALKHPQGWFAAGPEVERALTRLSDGAFKLFLYLCLNARRDTATLETTQTELARHLRKGATAIRNYLREMQAAGVCRSQFSHSPASRGRVEVTEAYWPYRKTEHEKPDDQTEAFVAALKKLLQARACVQTAFSTADEILARTWFQRGFSIEHLEHAILLGCVRKYASWRNNPKQGPIRSLRYFESLLEELTQREGGPAYWDYLRSRLQRMEKLWNDVHPPAAPTDQLATAPLQQPSPDNAPSDKTQSIPVPDSRSSTMSPTPKERR